MYVAQTVLAHASKESSTVAETVRSVLRSKGTEIWSVAPDSMVYDAIALMAEKHVGALLVVSKGKLAGIISERDYARKVVLKGKSSKDTPVSEIMTSAVVVTSPEHSIGECLRTMTDHRVRHLPVVERGELAGIVSMGDLVCHVIAAQADTIEQLSNYIRGV